MLNLPLPDHNRRWSLANIVFVTYTVFLVGFYVVPNAVDLYKFYVAAVFFPGLLLLPSALKKSRGSFIWLALLAYFSYMLLSSLWSESFTAAMLWRDFLYTMYILSFILLTLYFFMRNRLLPDAIMQGITLAVILTASVSILSFEQLKLLPMLTEKRLVGLGITDNPNPSAFIYGFFGAIALDYARQHWGEKLAYVYAAGAIIIAIFVILTQSNTCLLALSAAYTLLFLMDNRRTWPTVITGLLLALATSTYLAWSLGLTSTEIDIGFVRRLPIWHHIMEQWQEAPFFGHGYQKVVMLADNGAPSIMSYAHSTFLATLRDGGLVGLALLLLVYFFALRSALKMAFTDGRALYLCLFVFGLICVLADTDQIVTRPRELWIVLWLPLACLIAHELGLTNPDSPPVSDKTSSLAGPESTHNNETRRNDTGR